MRVDQAPAEPTIMRNLLALLAVIVLGFAGAGFWRGWYRVESLPAEPGRTAFRIEIDRLKVADDVGTTALRVIRALKSEPTEKTTAEAEVTP